MTIEFDFPAWSEPSEIYDQAREPVTRNWLYEMWAIVLSTLTIVALVFVMLGIGYHEYDRAFWISIGWVGGISVFYLLRRTGR